MSQLRNVVVAVALFLPLLGLAADGQTLKVTGSLWTPYLDQTLENNGIAAELVRTGLTRAGYELDPQSERWSRALRGGQLGIYDVIAAIWQTPARQRDFVFSDAYLVNDIVLLTRRNKRVGFSELDDLVGLRIGVETDFAYGGGFSEHPGLQRIANNHLVQNLLLLRKGELDAVIADKWSLLHEISRYMPGDVGDFHIEAKPVSRLGLRMAVSRENSASLEIVKAFNDAMADMRRDGTYEEIVNRHTGGYVVFPELD